VTPVIRAAAPQDSAALAALIAACLEPAWDAESLAAFLAVPGSFGFVASVPGGHEEVTAPAGVVLCRAAAEVCDVAAMAVAAPARRKGLGRALLAAACEEAAKRGARHMFLEVAESNAAAAALYRGQGFREVGKRLRYYPGGGARAAEDALLLRRDL